MLIFMTQVEHRQEQSSISQLSHERSCVLKLVRLRMLKKLTFVKPTAKQDQYLIFNKLKMSLLLNPIHEIKAKGGSKYAEKYTRKLTISHSIFLPISFFI